MKTATFSIVAAMFALAATAPVNAAVVTYVDAVIGGNTSSPTTWSTVAGFANNSTVLQQTANPVATTEVSTAVAVASDTYDVWAFFWVDDNTAAGAATGNFINTLSAGLASGVTPSVSNGQFGFPAVPLASTLSFDAAVLTVEGNRNMYAAYLGQVTGTTITVYVNGTTSTAATWYDGIGYASTSTEIPTPAALPAGLGLIGILAMRRRRK